MKVSVPLVPVYYFEATSRSTRLIYYLPRTRLSSLVRRHKCQKQAMDDYPYGIEVGVNVAEYDLLQDEYGFQPPLPPLLTWLAFEGFWLHTRHTESSTSGSIDAEQLEAYGISLKPAVDDLHRQFTSSWESVVSQIENPAARNRTRQPFWHSMLRDILRRFPPSSVNPELPPELQEWCRVRMSVGLNAPEAFATAQFPRRRGKHGSRQ